MYRDKELRFLLVTFVESGREQNHNYNMRITLRQQRTGVLLLKILGDKLNYWGKGGNN